MVLVLVRLMSCRGVSVSEELSESEAEGGVAARFRVVDFLAPRLKNLTGPLEEGGISWVVVVGKGSDIVRGLGLELELELVEGAVR